MRRQRLSPAGSGKTALVVSVYCCKCGKGSITLFNVKPAVGFTLPSAGVTPAPRINRKMARTPFCSQVILGRALILSLLVSFFRRRSRVGGLGGCAGGCQPGLRDCGVLGEGLDVAHASLERGSVVGRGAAAGFVAGIDDIGAGVYCPGYSRPSQGARPSIEVWISRDCGVPYCVRLVAQEIAGGAQAGVCVSYSILEKRTLGERRARVKAALVGVRECDDLVKRALCDADRDRADVEGSVKERLRHQRTRDGRTTREISKVSSAGTTKFSTAMS